MALSPEVEEIEEEDPANHVRGSGAFSVSAFVRNSAANIVRIVAVGLVAILLPVFLTHRLPIKVYGAWVLILQLGSYVSYLNLGVQTALSKFIAEYEAQQDLDGCGRCASVALRIMLCASALGVILTVVLAAHVPELFRDMPAPLLGDVRLSVLIVGISLSIGLATSVFSGIFLGLQKYHIPMVITVTGRILAAVAICAAVYLHQGLIAMAVVTAILNLSISLAEVVVWRRMAGQVKVSLLHIDVPMLRKMLGYCAVLTVWSACMLCISGLDVTIVGHYAFDEVAFYSIANSPTMLILMIIGAVMGPLLPATSALSVNSTPAEMGQVLLRSTRYSTVLLLVTGLPVLVAAHLILRLWVGPVYALHSVLFLDMLLAANVVRNLCAPYATMVVATSRQNVASASPIAEGLINLCASVFLARHIGAVGVALGTLIGAVVGVAVHFAVSMYYTKTNFRLSRARLFLGGIVRPLAMAVPAALLVPYWWGAQPFPLPGAVWAIWAVATLLLCWFVSLTATDREAIRQFLQKRRGPA